MPERRPRWTLASLPLVVLSIVTMPSVARAQVDGGGQEAGAKRIELPTPWRPDRVGVRKLLFVDSTRSDTLSAREDDFRPVLVRIWYPVDSVTAAPRAYMPPAVAEA